MKLFILVVGYPNGDAVYHGPFKSKRRANQYGEGMRKVSLNPPNRWFPKELVVPEEYRVQHED